MYVKLAFLKVEIQRDYSVQRENPIERNYFINSSAANNDR